MIKGHLHILKGTTIHFHTHKLKGHYHIHILIHKDKSTIREHGHTIHFHILKGHLHIHKHALQKENNKKGEKQGKQKNTTRETKREKQRTKERKHKINKRKKQNT